MTVLRRKLVVGDVSLEADALPLLLDNHAPVPYGSDFVEHYHVLVVVLVLLLVQQLDDHLRFNGPLQLSVVLSWHYADEDRDTATLSPSLPIGTHYQSHLVAPGTDVKSRTIPLYVRVSQLGERLEYDRHRLGSRRFHKAQLLQELRHGLFLLLGFLYLPVHHLNTLLLYLLELFDSLNGIMEMFLDTLLPMLSNVVPFDGSLTPDAAIDAGNRFVRANQEVALHLRAFDQLAAAFILAGKREGGASIEMLACQVIVEPLLPAVRTGVGTLGTLVLVVGVRGPLHQLPAPVATKQGLVRAILKVAHHLALPDGRRALAVGAGEREFRAVHEVTPIEEIIDALLGTVGTNEGTFGAVGLDVSVEHATYHLFLA